MRKSSVARTVAGSIVGGLVASTLALSLSVPVASATTVLPAVTLDTTAPVIPNGTTINAAQNWLQAAFDARTQDLSALSNLVSSTKVMSPDAKAVNQILNATTNGVNALEQSSSNDNTLKSLRSDAADLVNFRVFAFVDPMVKEVGIVDTTSAAIQADVALEPGIAAALAANQLSNKNNATANADASDLNTVLGVASSLLSGVNSNLESFTAANYPTTTTAIASAKKSVAAAQDEVTQANGDIAQIVKLLTNASLTAHLQGAGAIRAFLRHASELR